MGAAGCGRPGTSWAGKIGRGKPRGITNLKRVERRSRKTDRTVTGALSERQDKSSGRPLKGMIRFRGQEFTCLVLSHCCPCSTNGLQGSLFDRVYLDQTIYFSVDF